MPILELHIAGFKSLREATWLPGSLNVLIGPNASGKSNLLNALQFLRTTASGGLSEHVQQDGGINSLLWDGSERELMLTVVLQDVPEDNAFANYTLTLRSLGNWNRYSIDNEHLIIDMPSAHNEVTAFPAIVRNRGDIRVYDDRTKSMEAVDTAAQRLSAEETMLSALPPFTNMLGFLFKSEVQMWGIYVGIDTSANAVSRLPALTRRETVVSGNGDNLISVLHTLYTENRQFRSEMNTAMRAAFNDEFEELIFPPASDQRVQMRVHWRGLKNAQPTALLSDGTLRFLYLITILANPNPPPLIAIEEPEVGLHPSMLPIIAEYAAQASKRTQVILTTHSADFLDAFRDTGVTPTTTVAQRRNGETELRVLGGDELEYWLREYTLGQLFRSNELEQIG